MNQIRFIDEGNDDDFGPDEFIPTAPQSEKAKELQDKLRAQATARYVRLADDVAESFPTSEAVNAALRRLLDIEQRAA
jgi:EAL domain-containing protein (putative c-di-GMP-specific phosphodiesterase class I)